MNITTSVEYSASQLDIQKISIACTIDRERIYFLKKYLMVKCMSNPEIFFSNKKVLITGASGFIGRHLLHQVHTYGSHISTISRNNNDFPKDVEQHIVDITDTNAIEECVHTIRPDYIFHLAAYKERNENVQGFYSSVETNLIGSLNLFSAVKNVGSVKSIVTLGTIEEYGNNRPPFDERFRESPVTPYSFSKICVSHMGEMFFHLYGLPVVIVRPALTYGPGQGTEMFLPSLITSLIEDKPFNMTPGEQTRDFVFVTDLVEGLILASVTPKAQGQIINLGSGVPVKLIDLANTVETMTGKKGLVNPGGKSYGKNEVMEYYLDIRKAGDLLGWKAKTQMGDGLAKTIAYYREVKDL
ncbi:MAG: NAD(P)-dependent oxidoreductase [Methanospirillum sp.]|uniref:NAD-dependent epimerase/dehydratase family protein n=1 Tax=Methanospirillum sp. TaxID=45200 RepID=UPI0023751D0D|nr:NAD(P)-dependent oxidoreductase [Methanospirillum sp.]MDD1729109.1 NAD(P)-dependent oxidoreductase [Methanospirillum sp.]